MRVREIKFYTTGDQYDIFSNVTDIGFQINIGGVDYQPKSSEAVYQGVKALSAPDTNDQAKAKKIFTDQRNPGKHLQEEGNPIRNGNFRTGFIFFAGYQKNSYSFAQVPENVELKEQVMYETLLAKFTQHPALLKALLETGDALIIENTTLAIHDDDFWGNGKSGNGKNALGIALMRVREDVGNELRKHGKITIRTGLSDALADQLKIPRSKPIALKTITQKDLNAVPAATTVAAFHQSQGKATQTTPTQKMAAQGAPNKQQPSITSVRRYPAQASQQHSQETALDRLRKATGDGGLKIIVDDHNRIQLHFSNPKSANKFASDFGKVWRNEKAPSHFSIGTNQEEFVFGKLKIPTHGYAAQHPFGDALKYDFRQENKRINSLNK